jgi:hypothetical protein
MSDKGTEKLLALRGRVDVDYDWEREEELELKVENERASLKFSMNATGVVTGKLG